MKYNKSSDKLEFEKIKNTEKGEIFIKFTIKRTIAVLLTCSVCVVLSACAPSGDKEEHTGSQSANTGGNHYDHCP